jgi:tetratricopeptide (TPR) repeat protein
MIAKCLCVLIQTTEKLMVGILFFLPINSECFIQFQLVGRLGLAYSKLQKFELALEAYENALRIEPDNTDYQNNMRITQQKFEGKL